MDETDTPLQVAVWGPGNVGLPAIRTILAHPGLALRALLVHSEEKDGIVTPGTYPLMDPPSAPPALRERFEEACRRGGSRFLCSGIDPGFAMDLVPLVMSSVCTEIREIRMIENFNYATYEVPESVRAMIGFGSALDAPPPMLLPGVPRSVWGPMVRALARALDLPLEGVEERVERHPLERDVEVPGLGVLRAGTQGAFRFEVQGIAGGRPVLVVEHVTRIVDDTAPQWPRARGMGHHQVRIRGRPDLVWTLEATAEGGDHVAGGNTSAAARLVHAIPRLRQAPVGLIGGIDLPLVVGRGIVRTGYTSP